MSRQLVEHYHDKVLDRGPRCAVSDCSGVIVAEIFDGDYAAALELFRGIRRKQIRVRRFGDERIYTCQTHMEEYQFLGWQLLMF